MPGLSGEALICALRSSHPQVPILMCCGHPIEELRTALVLPLAAYLSKPFTSYQLLAAVAGLLTPTSG